ncbi:MAG: ATP-binding cassette domain-containing protein [Deltaproteobacteria bacterium]|nr:ATP-binding cassette domain-containing protein [Deltaproteobacteria bacterium]
MLSVRSLTKRYGATAVVDGVDFEVAEGEIVGFLGPNGAGKSTTLKMITGFLAPTAGAVRVNGIDALKHPRKARRSFGYMPEGVPLHPELRVHEYLRFRAELKGVPSRKIGDAIERSLDQASVTDAENRIIRQLSKGYRQRVGLADALLSDPPLLILDEPSSGLDPNQIRYVRELIRDFSGKKTVFLSTHILPEVEATCDRVVIINKGKKVGEGDPRSLRSERKQAFFVRFVGIGTTAAFREALQSASYRETGLGKELELEADGDRVRGRLQVPDEDAIDALFRAIAGAGLTLRELGGEARSLESLFTELTTEEAPPDPVEDEEEDDEELDDVETSEEDDS